ncbi:MAG TPA: DNA polymerase I [Tepidisphaeraceae bacterium]|nr:DNA polymerase I [Tepidisphaeraceae bacterium]
MGKSFYIIDGHAQIFRAFYAPFRELSSPTGEPTKATYVFTQMLLNLISQRKPDYLAMVIDSGDEYVFRKEIYPEYKANRQDTPVDLEPQEKRILRIVKDAGIPVFARRGFEADDLIATMARKLCDQGWDIVLVSKDKDLRQLINDCTRMYDVQSDTFTDAAKMETDLGYGPGEAVEVQTLMGDNIDNVPGIPGVGEKTAAKLIKKYGRAEAVLEHLDELTPKLRENFEKFGEVLPTTRKLVTLKNDVEFEFRPEDCKFFGVDMNALKGHFEELGFSALLKRLGLQEGQSQEDVDVARRIPTRKKQEGFSESLFGPPAGDAQAPAAGPTMTSTDCDYRLITSERQFTDFLTELKKQKRFAFDTETDALGAMNSNLIGLSFSWEEGTGWYVPVKGPAGCEHLPCEKVLAALKTVLEDAKVGKIGHNIKYDLLVMRNAGITLRGIVMDTMIAAFLLDASRMQFGIDQLARDLLNFKKISTTELIGKGKEQVGMHRLPLEQVARYAAEDADVAWRLGEMLRGKLSELSALQKLNDDLETPLVDVVAEMEFNGVAIDPKILKQQSEVLGTRADALRGEIMEAAGCSFNPDSTKQLADVLFNKLGLKVIKRNKTGPSTDVMVLERLAAEHRCPRLILEYRSLVKLKNTYLDNLTDYVNPRTNRIHASFNQTGAATGRLSCSDPNLQNIPIRTDEGRRIRLAFVAGGEDKVLLTADYSQIELRVLAHFTEEPALLKAFEADEDIHRAVASEVFNVPLEAVSKAQRGQAKTINFGIIYGVSAMGLARRIEGLSVTAAQDLINAYNKRFPSILKFMDKCVMDAQANGFVETILGRRRRIPELQSPVLAQRNAGERMAINSVVQGSAADLIKVAMLNIFRRLKEENRPSKLLMQVHDELVFESPAEGVEKEAAMIQSEMNRAMTLKVPLKVEVGWGTNWQEVK